jgi:hypothetical protein
MKNLLSGKCNFKPSLSLGTKKLLEEFTGEKKQGAITLLRNLLQEILKPENKAISQSCPVMKAQETETTRSWIRSPV